MTDELKTIDAGPYTLVARLHNGSYRGALWHTKQIVFDVRAGSIDEVWRLLCDALYKCQVALAAHRNGQAPTADEAHAALVRIAPRLTVGHKAMLRAHLRAPERNITATQLAEAAGYVGYSAANLQYGLLGAMLFAELPEVLPQRKSGSPIMTCAIASADDRRASAEDQWIWQMRPHIAQGLELARIA
jgi:hypothetical protein